LYGESASHPKVLQHPLNKLFMPLLHVNHTDIWYEVYGQGPETVVFSHGLLWSGEMFRAQIDFLKERYRIITFDHRGQGRTPGKAPYDMDTLSMDAIALIEALCNGPVHFAGLSMGGFIGMRIAARRPDLLRSLILLNTSAGGEALKNVPKYTLLNLVVRLLGLPWVTPSIMKIMFSPVFLNNPSQKQKVQYWERQLTANRPDTITKAVDGVIGRKPILPELKKVSCPTLIITGADDVATPTAKGRTIQQHIRGSQLITIPSAGHSSTIEQPEAVNTAIGQFLSSLEGI
jgi:3-oxoadipate enol-lactonase